MHQSDFKAYCNINLNAENNQKILASLLRWIENCVAHEVFQDALAFSMKCVKSSWVLCSSTSFCTGTWTLFFFLSSLFFSICLSMSRSLSLSKTLSFLSFLTPRHELFLFFLLEILPSWCSTMISYVDVRRGEPVDFFLLHYNTLEHRHTPCALPSLLWLVSSWAAPALNQSGKLYLILTIWSLRNPNAFFNNRATVSEAFKRFNRWQRTLLKHHVILMMKNIFLKLNHYV